MSEPPWRTIAALRREVALCCDLSGRVAWADEAAERLLGIREGSLLADCVPDGSREELQALLARAAAEPVRDWDVTVCVDGQPVTVACASVPDGDGICLVGSLVPADLGERLDEVRALAAFDSADRKALGLEQERRRAEELAEANNRKDQFLAMLAHELRNPLNAIATANALSGRLTATDERQGRIRDTIARQTGHLSRLVEDLLEVSRLTRGQLQLQVRDVELVETLRHAVEASRTFVDARRHRLQLELPAGPLRLRGDPLRLEQVFVNVINNAAKYSEPGSEILLSCTVARGGEAVVRIRDQGVGIPQHYLEAVFDLFVQVDASLARTLGGVGIGLTLARGLVEQHGGRIHAESAGPGRGSEIIVTLPLAAAAAQEPCVSAGTPRALRDARALTVLIVDDNVDSVEMLRTLLETRRHTVHAAYDGLSGLQAALAVCPDVALIDIGLPGIDGYEVAAGIRASGQARDTYLVAVTGYGRPEHGARAIEAGFDHHLVKPVDFGDLERVLDRVASRVEGEQREMRDDGPRRPEGRSSTADAGRHVPDGVRRTPDA